MQEKGHDFNQPYKVQHKTIQKMTQNQDAQKIILGIALELDAEMTGCEVLHGDLVGDNGVTW